MDLARIYVRSIRGVRALRDRLGSRQVEPEPEPVNGYEVLEKVASLPISTWSYSWEPQVRHLGPMAQDFAAAFGLGDSDRRIHLLDASGVALVAIQALYRKLDVLEGEVAALQQRLDEVSGTTPTRHEE